VESAALPTGLIDSDILIDLERGIADAMDFFAAQHRLGRVQISSISAMELIQGCRNKLEITKVEKSLLSMVIHEVSAAESRHARAWLTQFSLSHGLKLVPQFSIDCG